MEDEDDEKHQTFQRLRQMLEVESRTLRSGERMNLKQMRRLIMNLCK